MADLNTEDTPPESADQASSGPSASPDGSTAEDGTLRLRPRRPWFYLTFVVLCVTAFVVLRLTDDSSMGPSIPNFASMVVGAVLVAGTLLWLLTFAPLPWRTRFVGIGLLLLPVAALPAVFRDFGFDGDMQPFGTYRWEALVDRAEPEPITLSAEEAVAPAEITPEDYAEYRGARRDGRVVGSYGWLEAKAPVRERWRVSVGGGYAGMAVVGDRLVTMEQLPDGEAVSCFDVTDGNELWRHVDADVLFTEAMGGTGPRTTPTIRDGFVYTHGATGLLSCFSLADGAQRWTRDTVGDFKLRPTMWGQSSSPLVMDGLVIVSVGDGRSHGLVAYAAESGEFVWRSDGLTPGEAANPGNNGAGYSSPMVATIDGVRQVLNFDGFGLRGHSPEDGRPLWFVPWTNGPLVNVAQPIIFKDGRIFISASYNVGSAMLQIARTGEGEWSISELWTSRRMRCKFCSPVEKDGFLYGLDEGVLVCLRAEDGKRMWKGGRYGHGQILLAGDVIVVGTEDGRLVAVRATPDDHEELSEHDVLTTARIWNPLTLAGGAAYFRDHQEMVRLDAL